MSAAASPNLVSFPATDAERENAPTLKPWQDAVIKLLAQGCSITEAMRRVRLTDDAFYKACKRQPEFAERTEAARELHRVQIEDAFHSSEANARRFVDLVQRDLNAPLGLRLRASLAILNRKTGAWLPQALPSVEANSGILDTLDILDKPDTLDIHSGAAGTEAASLEPAIAEDETLQLEDLSGLDDSTASDTPDTLDTLDNTDSLDTLDTPDTLDELDNLDIPDARETAEVLDELTACFGSRELAERFYALASQQDARAAR